MEMRRHREALMHRRHRHPLWIISVLNRVAFIGMVLKIGFCVKKNRRRFFNKNTFNFYVEKQMNLMGNN